MKKIIIKKLYNDIFLTFATFLIIMSTIVLTIQAVNFFDYVTEDGHSLKIYFMYTFLNFPKIFSRVLPFIFFLTVFYLLISYEKKNELNIFWINGISKIEFLNKLILLTIFITIFQIFLTSYLSPMAQLKGRNFLKNSNMDFFTSLIKKGKFINIAKNITIYIENENKKDEYENIFIEDTRSNNSRMIFAKKGKLIDNINEKKFQLFNGRVVNSQKSNLNIFNFNEIDFQLKELGSKTIIVPKIQEINTLKLIDCLRYGLNFQNNLFRCEKRLNNEIKKELFKRIYKPIFLIIIAIVTCFLLFKNNYYSIFGYNVLIILYSEISLRYFGISNFFSLIALIVPIIILIFTYYTFRNKSKYA
jgi:lipopolysaccharide export system permease protein